jgi:hypothetical protein
VPPYCIGLANIATDFVVGQPSFFERTSECGEGLCGVPCGATPSLKPETWRAVDPHPAGPAFVVQHFAIGEIAPLNQSRTIRRFRTWPLDRQLRCSNVATAEEVEVNSYPVCVRACADVSAGETKPITVTYKRSV